MIIETKHIQPKLTDYVLDLLPRPERQVVEWHVAHCAKCEQALKNERLIGTMMQRTLKQATQPANGRLRQLMPPIPQKQQRTLLGFAMQRQLASLCVMLLLIVGGFGWYESQQNHTILPLSPTSLAVTATHTTEPTLTATSTDATTVPMETAVSHNPAPEYSPTPPPNPTPVAVISALSN
ncbi:MAG: zf-HC2 domain-containing protein [Chloroflexi bacterium]|nr:zf-HC2 domain-containing protein [Chloroflexota bacterium]